MDRALIERAINSAKARTYKLSFDENGNISAHHQKKVEKQKEVMEVTVEALWKQIPMNPMYRKTNGIDFVCPVCKRQVTYELYCCNCGQRLDWGE